MGLREWGAGGRRKVGMEGGRGGRREREEWRGGREGCKNLKS